MSVTNPFIPRYSELPDSLPVFPLPGAIVLPGCDLHLNIFEPRYLNMVNDALSSHRMIVMIQPSSGDETSDIGASEIYKTGCAGRITTYQETNDGRIMIVLTGICRVSVIDENLIENGYRLASLNWSEFSNDMGTEPDVVDVDQLMASIEQYLGENDLQTNIESLKKLAPEILVNTLAMHMPFEVVDKQALIEAATTEARAKLLTALCSFSSSDGSTSTVRH